MIHALADALALWLNKLEIAELVNLAQDSRLPEPVEEEAVEPTSEPSLFPNGAAPAMKTPIRPKIFGCDLLLLASLILGSAGHSLRASDEKSPNGQKSPKSEDAYDVVILGGRVVDGTGDAWFRGDVAIRGERRARRDLSPQSRQPPQLVQGRGHDRPDRRC